MASCTGITAKEITSTKVYLKGYVTGLSSSKEYCLHYFSGGWKTLPNASLGYTYITNRTSFDLSSIGCYVPTIDLVEGSQFEVRLHEVTGNCETNRVEACTKILYYEVIENKIVWYYVVDGNRNPVNNAKVECSGETLYTGSDGKASQVLETGTTYYAYCYAPSGYECVNCYESFYHDSDRVVNFEMKTVIDTVMVDIRVEDQFDDAVVGVQVNIPTAEGAKTITTDVFGVATGFTLESGVQHIATITYVPSGYSITDKPSIRFTPTHDTTYLHNEGVKIDECINGETQTQECWDGSTITTFNCVNGEWVPTTELCPPKECNSPSCAITKV